VLGRNLDRFENTCGYHNHLKKFCYGNDAMKLTVIEGGRGDPKLLRAENS
jgi:hypothetical protein